MTRAMVFLFVLALVLFVGSLLSGALWLSLAQFWAALWQSGDPVHSLIIWQIRLPRTLLAFFIGAGLGASGAALQGYLRNPLADPGIVGISASASLGAVAILYFGLATHYIWALPLAAMGGAGLAALILLRLARDDAPVTHVILGGVALSSLAVSLTALLMNLSPNPWALSEIAYWLMGSVAGRGLSDLVFAVPLILFGIALLWRSGAGLNALGLGEDTARTLGVSPGKTGRLVVLGTLFCVGAGVAVSGAIGFVGLAAPHLVRPFFGVMPGRLILPSALAGGCLLLLADIVVRLLSGPGTMLYLGVVTALLGAPFFLYLIWTQRRVWT